MKKKKRIEYSIITELDGKEVKSKRIPISKYEYIKYKGGSRMTEEIPAYLKARLKTPEGKKRRFIELVKALNHPQLAIYFDEALPNDLFD